MVMMVVVAAVDHRQIIRFVFIVGGGEGKGGAGADREGGGGGRIRRLEVHVAAHFSELARDG